MLCLSFLKKLLPFLQSKVFGPQAKNLDTVYFHQPNRICSDNGSFDLERCLMEKGYNEKMIRYQILRTHKHSTKDLLENEKRNFQAETFFNTTFYPDFQFSFRNIVQERHLLWAPHKAHKNMFPDAAAVGFCNGKSLEINATWKCESCGNWTCLVCNSIRAEAYGENFKIQSSSLSCDSEKQL